MLLEIPIALTSKAGEDAAGTTGALRSAGVRHPQRLKARHACFAVVRDLPFQAGVDNDANLRDP